MSYYNLLMFLELLKDYDSSRAFRILVVIVKKLILARVIGAVILADEAIANRANVLRDGRLPVVAIIIGIDHAGILIHAGQLLNQFFYFHEAIIL